MSASQSNLSDSKYGYDLVIAVTQASINVTMKEFLSSVKEPEVTVCYVYDQNNDLQPIDYATLIKNANGSDPFNVADGADANTNQDLINLTNANFAGAVKAQIGLPPKVTFANLPPIVTLMVKDVTNAVTFNLLCSEFEVCGFFYGPRNKTTWINKAQNGQTTPSKTPWYFSSNITLNNITIAPSLNVPPAVQARVQELSSAVGPDAFSVQQLFLDLTTAMAYTTPTIDGVDSSWPVWGLINSVFVDAYFKQLAVSGSPVLSYSFSVKNPIQSTLQLGSISNECSPLTNNGQPIDPMTPQDLNATTFVYLGTTSTTPPIPVEFPWNWVELGDVSSFSGVLSTRRGAFLNFLANMLNQDVPMLCIQPVVDLQKTDKGYLVGYGIGRSLTPATFQVDDAPGAPGTDGFTDVMTVTFSAPASNDANDGTLSSVHGEFDYGLSGTLSVGNSNQIRLVMRAYAYMLLSHTETAFKVAYTDLKGANYYDKTYTFVFTMAVDQNDHLEVTAEQSSVDNSVAFNMTPGGLMGLGNQEDGVKNGISQTASTLTGILDNVLKNYGDLISTEINGYQGWVFPGASSFVCKDVAFSSGLDLITQLTYANPAQAESPQAKGATR